MFAPADDYVRLVIHNALRLAIINYGPHMRELVGRYRLPLAGGAQDNSAGLIRIFGNFTGYRHHEVRVVVMLVVAECALVTHFMPLRLEVLDKFFFEPIPRVVRADVDFHTQIIHFRARNENCPPNSSRRGRVSITKRDPASRYFFFAFSGGSTKFTVMSMMNSLATPPRTSGVYSHSLTALSAILSRMGWAD